VSAAANRRGVVLGVSASVAIYKACEIASSLTQKGYVVRVALTPAAARLVSPLLFRAVTGQAACADEFAPDAPSSMTHIDFADAADVFLAAPATADLVARLALGMADDLVTTTALALRPEAKRILAPAMNPRMLAHPLVQKNLATLRELGWQIVEPEAGRLACGVQGEGRLADPARIVDAVEKALPLL
jgi:phosphopantothenoylcysteine synthetase/decarboxylase